MTNFEYYKEELIELGKTRTFFEEPFIELYKRYGDLPSFCNEHIIEWLYDENKEPILTDEEKNYLEGILKPFKDRVVFIMKKQTCNGDWLLIRLKKYYDYNMLEDIDLPFFKQGTMYKNMTIHKEYTLEELELFEEN